MTDAIVAVLLAVGSFLTLLAGVGVARFPDAMARMHAAAKAPILGFMLIGVGVMLSLQTTDAVAIVVLVIVLQAIAVPVGSHVLARSMYYRMKPELDGPDALAEADARAEPDDA
jgi:multicomponent Na+:H+ antiporter subunit G